MPKKISKKDQKPSRLDLLEQDMIHAHQALQEAFQILAYHHQILQAAAAGMDEKLKEAGIEPNDETEGKN